MSIFTTGIIGFLAGLAGAWFIARYAHLLGLVDHPNQRSSHALPTPRGGGIGLFFAAAGSGLFYSLPWGLWLPGCLLSCISFVDDRLGLSSRLRLLIQAGAALLVVIPFFWGDGISTTFFFLIVFWAFFIAATANFYNFMDGINGMAGLTGGIAFGLLAFYSWKMAGQPELAIFSLILAAGCLGFLPFNFPRAKVFMGDVGSILLGFLYAVMVVHLATGLGDFLCLVSFLFPFYADAASTMFIRWRNREDLFQAHRKHLYQILANELGFEHWVISLMFGLVQLSIGCLMIFSSDSSLFLRIAILTFFSITILVLGFLARKRAVVQV